MKPKGMKKPYTAPRLIKYGNLQSITRGGANAGSDGGKRSAA